MMQKRWLGRFLVLFLSVTATLVIALSNVAVQRASAAPKGEPPIVTKGSAMAVVYYRCVLEGNICKVWDGKYFVHNGKAYANFPNPNPKEKRVLILHAPEWDKVDLLHICGKTQAETYANIPPGPNNPCHGDKITADNSLVKNGTLKPDPVWRPWVWEALRQYGKKGTAITYMVDGEVHNGAFSSFEPTSGSPITTLPAGSGVISGTGHLKVWHYATSDGAFGHREASSAGAFKLRLVTVPPTASPAKIQVKRLPSEPTS